MPFGLRQRYFVCQLPMLVRCACSKIKLLNEIYKDVTSKYVSLTKFLLNDQLYHSFLPSSSYLHFSSIENASVFYNTYVDKGLTVNNMQFTVHPTKLTDGTLVTYTFQRIDFGNRSICQTTNVQAANTTTAPSTISEATANITNTVIAPTIIPEANADTTPSSEWVLSTKRAINEISQEIKLLKKRQRYLRKALKKEH
jgi:hypothetical protein